MHQRVAGQVGQRGRRAPGGEIGRAGAVDDRQLAQRAGHQGVVVQWTHPEHAVEPFADQIDPAVGTAHFHFHARVLGQEGRQLRYHQLPGQPAGHIHPQAPLQLRRIDPEHALQVVHVMQQIVCPRLELGTVSGQLHPAGGPMQQLHTHIRFQPLHGQRHTGLGETEAVGGAGEGAEFGHPEEAAQVIETIHGLFVIVG